MKRKFFLPLSIVIMLLLTTWFVYARDQKTRSTAQAWEYKRILISRQTEGDTGEFTKWSENSGGEEVVLPLPVNMTKRLNELGAQGWELVAVTPIANTFSMAGDYAGYTNQINYFLKRPR